MSIGRAASERGSASSGLGDPRPPLAAVLARIAPQPDAAPEGGNAAALSRFPRGLLEDRRLGALVESIVRRIGPVHERGLEVRLRIGGRLPEIEPPFPPWLRWAEIGLAADAALFADVLLADALVDGALAEQGLRPVERVRSPRGVLRLFWSAEADAVPVVTRTALRGGTVRLTVFHPASARAASDGGAITERSPRRSGAVIVAPASRR